MYIDLTIELYWEIFNLKHKQLRLRYTHTLRMKCFEAAKNKLLDVNRSIIV